MAEAARWKLLGEAVTPSDSDESYGSSDGNRGAELSFEPSDLIILGISFLSLWYSRTENLVADDVPDMLGMTLFSINLVSLIAFDLDYVKNILSRYCRVVTATNGQVALELARKHPPHLIISDVMMPG